MLIVPVIVTVGVNVPAWKALIVTYGTLSGPVGASMKAKRLAFGISVGTSASSVTVGVNVGVAVGVDDGVAASTESGAGGGPKNPAATGKTRANPVSAIPSKKKPRTRTLRTDRFMKIGVYFAAVSLLLTRFQVADGRAGGKFLKSSSLN